MDLNLPVPAKKGERDRFPSRSPLSQALTIFSYALAVKLYTNT